MSERDVQDLNGVTTEVTGRIERPDTQPWLVVKSTISSATLALTHRITSAAVTFGEPI